jgi:hypothetical protein
LIAALNLRPPVPAICSTAVLSSDPSARMLFGYAMNKYSSGTALNTREQSLISAAHRSLPGCVPGCWLLGARRPITLHAYRGVFTARGVQFVQ